MGMLEGQMLSMDEMHNLVPLPVPLDRQLLLRKLVVLNDSPDVESKVRDVGRRA